ncbi:hypothetical protein OKW33_007756 [Paraburkholderia atlantica]|uniref:hypothetical protein n=1 Tax=Paraburkholderia atlantica TaxID=2654982 RepID=UPI00128BF4CF|nr:hypothetical protein [Paraburkholderia atlantica]MBB5415190.1 hypothetical protein [Paraburkholderia atlantica]MPW08290.1 hypothetical protein [Paraburkholderia atlantica]
MKFNDTAPVMEPAGGPPLWLTNLTESATLEATVLKRPIEGRADILSVIKHAVSLYEFQHHSYKAAIGNGLYIESYRSQIQGVPIETVVVAHMNEQGETESVVINHRPLNAMLLFSKLMWERVDERFRDRYLTGPEATALNTVSEDCTRSGCSRPHDETASS